ncbi:MAG: nucleotidyltransferase family protein [Armatimonadetes bacterium]|nr:nucleotidyltransferase family protein [Armatimonadota bacterium]
MTVRELVHSKRDEVLRLAALHKARRVCLFGSAVRGEEGPDSDVDFLVEFQPEASLLDHVRLMQDLERLLGRKVDVVSDRALHWFIRDRVRAEASPL